MGSILGDGYLRIVPGRSNALFEVNHSIKERDYVNWKYKKLKKIVKSPPKERKGNNGRIAYRFSTRQHHELTEIYHKFYQRKRKIIPKFKLNPLILAVWFMDDGNRTYQTYYLNTQGFDYVSQKKLVKMLRNQYGIKSALNRDKEYYRIRIKQESAEKLRDIILDKIIPSMKYKLK